MIREQRKIQSASVLAKETDQLLVRVVGGCVFSLLKRISAAVGSEELQRDVPKCP